jgi:FKBP-type peptidyl-prolyl cis-trans isomerase FkpA
MRRLALLAALVLGFVMTSAIATDDLAQLGTIDQQVGTGAVARTGRQVEVNYTGWLYDAGVKDHRGAKIDSSYDRHQTISFVLGENKVIAGWNKGIKGMRVGGHRTLLIPSRLAYGGRRVGNLVPPHAALIFDIELVGVH